MTFLLAGSAPTPSSLLGVVVYLMAALASGGAMNLAYQLYIRHKRGRTEDDELVSKVSAQVIEGAKGLLDEYRIQLEVAERQIEAYMTQMSELNRLLGEANARIQRLETQLEQRRDERADLRRELEEEVGRRNRLLAEMNDMRRRISELERA